MSASPVQSTPSLTRRFGAPLAQARSRFAGSGLQQFLAWWGSELAQMLPASWRAVLVAGRARVLYVPLEDEIELRVEEGDRVVPVGRFARPVAGEDEGDRREGLRARVDARLGAQRADRPRWLMVAHGQLLRRTISLPAAAGDRLRAVVGFELDRQTPFRAEQVSFDCRVLSVDAASKMAQVEMLVLPNDRLEAALAALGPLATGLRGVDAFDAQGMPLRCNLLPDARRKAPDRRRLWLDLGLAAFAVIALAFGMLQTLDNRQREITRLQAEVDRLHEQARTVNALVGQLKGAAEGANFLATRRAAQPPMLAVLADISARIPDNTFLERFSEQDGQVYLTGLSSDAAGLVGKLQGSPLLRAPALSGSVQPDAATKRDRFTLAANLATSGKPATAPATNASTGGSDAASP